MCMYEQLQPWELPLFTTPYAHFATCCAPITSSAPHHIDMYAHTFATHTSRRRFVLLLAYSSTCRQATCCRNIHHPHLPGNTTKLVAIVCWRFLASSFNTWCWPVIRVLRRALAEAVTLAFKYITDGTPKTKKQNNITKQAKMNNKNIVQQWNHEKVPRNSKL